MNLENKIEAIIFFKSEPLSISELSKILGVSREEVMVSIESLSSFYAERGIVLVTDGDLVSFGTNGELSPLIEGLQKEEFSRDLTRAALETLSVILYRGPIARREIDRIRGVNSGFILRNLLIRGLIERVDSTSGERSYTYKPSLKLLEHLGVKNKEELPEYETAFKSLEEFVNTTDKDERAE